VDVTVRLGTALVSELTGHEDNSEAVETVERLRWVFSTSSDSNSCRINNRELSCQFVTTEMNQ